MGKPTIKGFLDFKGSRKLTLTTAFDYSTARACELAGIDMIVTWSPYNDTLEGLSTILGEVRRGAPNTLIGAGIPRSLAYVSDQEAVRSALAALKYGADMVYSSGNHIDRFKALAKQRIPCVGHVGLVPVHSTWIGGLRAVGKTAQEALQVYRDTLAFQEAGAVAVEMECVPHKVAAEITKRVDLMVLSMGSGASCDGQFLFSSDLLGTHDGHYPRHSKKYGDFYQDSISILAQYRDDVHTGAYPATEHIIEIEDREFESFMEGIHSIDAPGHSVQVC